MGSENVSNDQKSNYADLNSLGNASSQTSKNVPKKKWGRAFKALPRAAWGRIVKTIQALVNSPQAASVKTGIFCAIEKIEKLCESSENKFSNKKGTFQVQKDLSGEDLRTKALFSSVGGGKEGIKGSPITPIQGGGDPSPVAVSGSVGRKISQPIPVTVSKENAVPKKVKRTRNRNLNKFMRRVKNSKDEKNIKLAATLTEILEYVEDPNVEVRLLIGRSKSEPLPKEKEGVKWVSLDIAEDNTGDSEGDRLHLTMDFNEKRYMGLLDGLFNEVVVDPSVVKFYTKTDQNGIVRDMAKEFKKLLAKNPESTLIFESDLGISSLDPKGGEVGLTYEGVVYGLDMNEKEKKEHHGKCIDHTVTHLETLFGSVEHRPEKSSNYPHYFREENTHSYFVLKDPK